MSNIGYIALLLALFGSLYAAFACYKGARSGQGFYLQSARRIIFGVCGLVSLATLVLLIAILTHNFQIEYVSSYSSRDMAWPYLVSALWAGNNGSMLFWAWLLSIFAVITIIRQRDRQLFLNAAAVVMLTEAFFLVMLISISNPFHTLAFTPGEGRGLNPLLENPGMIIHPPLLLAGYVGLTVPFGLAVGALVSRKPGTEWLTSARNWILFAWLLLGVGNIIGAWWAYVELGWGGYWAWDPVENAGLMPWLIATAFLHSLMMEKRRGILRVWNMVLIILAFNLAIFGTFITRSGILSSVHTFGDSKMVPFFTLFLLISFFGSLTLLYARRKALKDKEEVTSLVSREGTFQLNNVLLVGATMMIFLGTVYPAFFEAVTGAQISIGASFFNTVNGPLFLAIILLIGICTVTGWRQVSAMGKLLRKLLWPAVLAVITGALIFILGMRNLYALVAFIVSAFAFFTIVLQWGGEVRVRQKAKGDNYLLSWAGLLRSSRARYGAYIVHIAIVLMAAGIIGSSFYEVETEAVLERGDTMSIGDYTLTYHGLTIEETATRGVVTASIEVSNNGKPAGFLTPEKLFHLNYEQPVTEVAIRSTLLNDLYVILVGWEQDGSAAFQVLINPLVIWIWIGGAAFLIGGLIALWPEKTRRPPATEDKKSSPSAGEEIEKRVKQLRKQERASCSKCGTPAAPGARFCSRCGEKLS